MNIALITLFLLSLSAIAFMIGKKLVLIRKGEAITVEEGVVFFEIPYFEEVKLITRKSLKRGGYLALVGVIRFYFRSSNFMRKEFTDFKVKSGAFILKYKKFMPIDHKEKQEISKFLRTMSEYKAKLGEIKNSIKEEEFRS